MEILSIREFIGHMLWVALQGYSWLLFGYILAGWFVRNRYAGWYVFLQEMCEPPLSFVRRITQNRLVVGGLDLSPILLFFGIQLLSRAIGAVFLG
ncbi:YggT family protein [Sulfidibacter corallicola]|uniref:YggT family protein n=1 Tax=Sulfidibacter corallicola TaxID=2818388 RepID=A0A8A4U3J4_SULCO|nr:YggT family protein [Sulfidibacter corallicola]QTD53315.1 YggT family protein [Sulfidibacter corallicola]